MKFHVVVILLCAFASVSLPSTNGFNVETQHYTVYRQEQNSMFGFSVAEQLDSTYRGWVIVGAPEAQTEQPDVYRGGSVYRCDLYQDNGCTPIYFDTEGNDKKDYEPGIPIQFENKTLQWFGASVSTSQIPDGPILLIRRSLSDNYGQLNMETSKRVIGVAYRQAYRSAYPQNRWACAPRYIWFSTGGVRREPIGTCYMTKNSFREPKEFSPCRTRHWGYHRQGSCQAGLGAALSNNGERVFIGAPGSYYWQGQAYSVDSNANFPYIPSRFSYFGNGAITGQTISASTRTLPAAAFTKEGQAIEDDSYLGYSVASGDFEGNGEIGAAVGMPRGDNLQGKVVLLRANMTFYNKNLTGLQMGAYFGYAVISCDVDGDGLDDLVVGAPMYTVQENPEMTFETGRVHIFYQGSGAEKFTRTETRDGSENRGRFGLSLASLKDMNRDGYQDFAVGAPYGGPDGRGAVYVFYGSKNGAMDKYSQAIYAQQLQSPISTFGFSIAGGLDLDGNQYPDMVVGAYESSAAAFFRARPVFDMEGYVAFDSTSKFISLEEKNCTLNDGSAVPCLPLSACLNYTGIGVGQSYEFNVQYFLDVKKPKNPRLFFVDYENRNSINQTIRLQQGRQLCKTFKVYVSPNIRDKLTSLEAEMRMSLVEDKSAAMRARNPREQLIPVLGATSSQPDSLTIFKKCGTDNVCVPNLQLVVQTSVEKYLLGSGEKLQLDVLVQNTGEDAFEAMYILRLPDGIDYVNTERTDHAEIPVQCSAPEPSNNFTLRCDIGNPLPENSNVHFKVFLQPVTKEGLNASYEMEMTVNSTNPEASANQADNTYHLSLPIWIQTELFIEGHSKPKELFYNFENYDSDNITSESRFGPVITHNYTIRNKGPSRALEVTAFLIWPGQTLAGDELVYLIEQPKTSGKTVSCMMANANYLSLELEDRRDLYDGSYGGFSELSSADRKIQMAEDARLKHQKETSGSQEGVKDYDYGSDFFFSNSSYRNFSSSGGSSRNFSFTGGSSVSSGSSGQVSGNFVSQQGSSGQTSGGVFIPGPEIVTEVYGGALESGNVRIPSRSGDGGGQITGETFGEANYEGSWNQNGASGAAIDPSIRVPSGSEGGRQMIGETGGAFGETHYERNWNQNGASGAAIDPSIRVPSGSERVGKAGEGGAGVTFSETHYERNWNRNNGASGAAIDPSIRVPSLAETGGGTNVETRHEQSSNRSGIFQQGWETVVDGGRGQNGYEVETNRESFSGASYAEAEQRRLEEKAMLRRIENERRLAVEAERRRVLEIENAEAERRRLVALEAESDRQRQIEARRLEIERERARSSERVEVRSGSYGTEKHFATNSGSSGSSDVHLANIGLPQDLEKFFSTMSRDAGSITTQSREGKGYVLFDGRFRVGGNIEYIEFKNGQSFQLLDKNGEPSRTTERGFGEEFAKFEGQLLGGTEDGSIFVELKDGRRFKIPGTYSYERKEIYTVGGGKGPRIVYGKRVTHRTGDDLTGEDLSEFGNNWREESSYRENWNSGGTEGRKTASKKYDGGSGGQFFFAGDNVPTQRPDDRANRYPRESDALDVDEFKRWRREHRRDRRDDSSGANRAPKRSEDLVYGATEDCDSAECARLRCTIGPMERNEEVWISMRARVKAKTLNEIGFNDDVTVSTQLIAVVTRQPFISGTPADQATKSHEIHTTIHPSTSPTAPDVIPLWVVVLSACAGTIILLLLIFLLYKCGFFKRNRPTDAAERQPLNRNDHYQN